MKVLDICNVDVTTTIEAFKMGLKNDSSFYEDRVMTPCKRLDEVTNIVLKFLRWEEDGKIQKRFHMPTSYDNPNRKVEAPSQKFYKPKPYTKFDSHRVNTIEDAEEEEDYLKITDKSL